MTKTILALLVAVVLTPQQLDTVTAGANGATVKASDCRGCKPAVVKAKDCKGCTGAVVRR